MCLSALHHPRRLLTMFLLMYWIVWMAVGESGHAQTVLERVSVSRRADGLGYVARFHFEAPVDSFKWVQPAGDLIQLIVYSKRLEVPASSISDPSAPLARIRHHELSLGAGFDIDLSAEAALLADVYRDQNGADLLLSLRNSTRDQVDLITDGIPRIRWDQFQAGSTSGSTSASTSATQGPSAASSPAAPSTPRSRQRSPRSDPPPAPPAAPDAAPKPDDLDKTYENIRGNMAFDVVVLDAGHGGHDPGSIGHRGIREKDITLAVTRKVGAYIEKNLPGVKVVYTREDDRFIELHRRGQIANRAKGDLFISIHCNAFSNRSAFGSEVFFLGLARSASALEVMKKENSVVRFEEEGAKASLTEEEILIYELANSGYIQSSQIIASQLEAQFRERARRTSRGVKQAGFVVLFHASMPAILIELGFISNPNEAMFLASEEGQDIMASAIYRAIRDYKVEYDASMSPAAR